MKIERKKYRKGERDTKRRIQAERGTMREIEKYWEAERDEK